jgi:hypothetical protein
MENLIPLDEEQNLSIGTALSAASLLKLNQRV